MPFTNPNTKINRSPLEEGGASDSNSQEVIERNREAILDESVALLETCAFISVETDEQIKKFDDNFCKHHAFLNRLMPYLAPEEIKIFAEYLQDKVNPGSMPDEEPTMPEPAQEHFALVEQALQRFTEKHLSSQNEQGG